jgi:flavin-dependent dehydrogenase
VIIVGAGPSGSTAAYYLSKHSSAHSDSLKIGLFDKKAFPRNKPCGDAWCKPALDILSDMGVLQKMESDGIVNVVKRGGLISPFGYRCINTDGASYGSVTGIDHREVDWFEVDNPSKLMSHHLSLSMSHHHLSLSLSHVITSPLTSSSRLQDIRY